MKIKPALAAHRPLLPMIYVLIDLLHNWLATHGLFGFVRVFTYIEFRAIASIVLGFLFVIILGPRVIRWLLRMKIGDRPEFYVTSLNELMKSKANTPTMGGILINGAILFCIFILADLRNFYIQMAVLCLVWMATLGAADDWLKLTSARRKPGSREGLYFWEKLVFQLGLAVILGLFIYHHGLTKDAIDPHHLNVMSHSLTLPFFKTWVWDPTIRDFIPSSSIIQLSMGAFVLLSVVVIVGASNAVNLTDGMDGLAGGIMSIVAFAFVILALLAGGEDGVLAKKLLIPYIHYADELAIVAGAMVGSCLGFLWYNTSPAQVFMGDTGSLPLGALIGFIAVVIRQEFLLLVIGGVFAAEALSVILQVTYFKISKGKRIFRCAPIHHHFHLLGWAENQVVVRFWIVSIILAACALLTIKLR